MKRKLEVIILSVSFLFISGCSSTKICKVKIYSSDRMTFNKQYEAFNWACRTVLYDLSYKEQDENGNTKWPYYGEGAESKTVTNKGFKIGLTGNKIFNNKSVYSKRYLRTQDDEGYEYTITTTINNNDNPEVVLETTNPDKDKLVNLLQEEFIKRGFKVTQIND